jgi:hypothetical protein
MDKFNLDHYVKSDEITFAFTRRVDELIAENYPIQYAVSFASDELREDFNTLIRLVRDMAMDHIASREDDSE